MLIEVFSWTIDLGKVLGWISAVSLSIAIAAAVAYVLGSRLAPEDGKPVSTPRRIARITTFTAGAAFIGVWRLLRFEQATLLVALIIAIGIGLAFYGLSLLMPDTSARNPLTNPLAVTIGIAYGALLLWGSFDVERIGSTSTAVFVAIFTSAALFIGVNRLFDLAPDQWPWFSTLLGAASTFGIYAILWGNRVLNNPARWTFIATIVGGAVGWLYGSSARREARLAIGVLGVGSIGLLIGLNVRRVVEAVADQAEFDSLVAAGILNADGSQLQTPIPVLSIFEAVIWLAVGAAIGLGIWQLRGRTKSPLRAMAPWAALGWGIGALVVPSYGSNSLGDAVIATTVLGALIGLSIGLVPLQNESERRRVETASRKYIFLTPALFFIAASLVVPTIRTAWLSFLDRLSVEAVGFQNYLDVFTDRQIINFDNWTGIFGSRMTWIGVVVIGLGVLAAYITGRQQGGTNLDFSPGTVGPMAFGIFLIFFAIFASLRGTIINNLWWVFTVTIVATAMGLAIAVLADRGKYENLAKSLIFMPMAISFVGAGIIWRFVYIARPAGRDQTGVLNSLWIWLGQISNSATGTALVVIILVLVMVALGYLSFRGYRAGANGVAVGSLVLALPMLWLLYRFVGPGLGGFIPAPSGDGVIADPVLFTSNVPFNNVWLMVVLIWIQTGFAMVIFSAAIKAVPTELLEAARVDGATESQSFWRVTIPQIAPTIGVVVTTLIVTVMKVFDIVRVMSGGNFDTNVIANEMYDKAFAEFNTGAGSALAIILFLAILPIMFYNIRRMQKAAV